MPGMAGGYKDQGRGFLNCMTYEPDQERDECCGASGRKMRRDCLFCPNYERYRRRKRENEGQQNEKGD